MDFSEFFSEKEIIKVLCNLRVNAARRRRRQHLSYNISRTDKNKPDDIQNYQADLKALYMMLPPRRLWNSRRPKKRQNQPPDSINKKAILTIALDRNNSKYSGEWSHNLESFIEEVRQKSLDLSDYQFETPKVTPIKKNPYLKEERLYRPISTYTKLIDQVVDKLCAKYLRHLSEPNFLDCSYAFRTVREDKPSPTHHDAVKKLVEFREIYSKEVVWVAECDIKKFFDCVNHDSVLNAIEASSHIQIDGRAKNILTAYLDSYSFPKTAKTQCAQYFQERSINGEIEWCQTELEAFYKQPNQESIGVPQGGALSCFIVNLLLDFADRQVLEDKTDPDLFYIRYCDDIIIVHKNEEGCNKALERYLDALKCLFLIPHPAEATKGIGKKFFQLKSKRPYKWGNNLLENNIPWISFLGYQIRHDGLVKIRPPSIHKELRKQVDEADRILKLIFTKGQDRDLKIRRSKSQILHSLQQKMISMSVGRVKIYREDQGLPSLQNFCWCGGFKLLANQEKSVIEQLKTLDRGRERQLSRVKRKLSELPKTKVESPTHNKALDYYGNPFSYYDQFFKGKK